MISSFSIFGILHTLNLVTVHLFSVSPVTSIDRIIVGNPHLQEFKKHVRKSGMRRNLQDNGTYTVFAPENPALRGLAADKK